MAIYIKFHIGSGNGLLPDGTKQLPEPPIGEVQWHSHENIFKANAKDTVLYIEFENNT